MSFSAFFEKLKTAPETVSFDDTMAIIENYYEFTEIGFSNGEIQNEAGQNNGSCKIFALGKLNQLTQDQTLHCFGRYYREDVLKNPDNTDHQNIRSFMKQGWQGIKFDGEALTIK